MLSLISLSTLLVQCSYALFEAKQRLIDLGSLDLPVLIIALAVLCTLATGEVDEE